MKKRVLAIILMVALAVSLMGTTQAATHTVVAGDSLSKLAEQYLGDRTKWSVIYEANKDKLSNPSLIYVGQELTIPGRDAEEPEVPAKPASSVAEAVAVQVVDKSTLPRVIVTTDLEVDDMNGILLTLMYSCDFDLAGIVWTAGQFHFTGDGEGTTLEEVVKEYEYGEENPYQWKCEATTAGGLVENAGQLTDFRPVDPDFLNRLITYSYAADYKYLIQNNPNYPTPEYLLSIAKTGNVAFEGDYRYETEGSQLIYDAIMDDDMRPLYIQHWGGINTTVRALQSIYEDYYGTEQWDEVLSKVVAKVRISGTGEDNCWSYSKMTEKFPGIVIGNGDFNGMRGFGNYFSAVLKGEGPMPFMGTTEDINQYYQGEWLTEAFKFNHGRVLGQFHLVNDGQVIYGEPLIYQYGLIDYVDWAAAGISGWGAASLSSFPRIDHDTYDWVCCQWGTSTFVDLGLRHDVANTSARDYTALLFEDLAARADWAICKPEDCNHAPIVRVATSDITASAGETVALNGTMSDPDGDRCTASWWLNAGLNTYANAEAELAVADADDLTTTFTVPADAVSGDSFVVTLEVCDNNTERPMTRFAQIVITVE